MTVNDDQVSDHKVMDGWWEASDGKWYAPELAHDHTIGGTPPAARVPGVPYTNSEGSIVDPGV